eukprot:Selendium_serpulae@DN5401_c0_g1_i1.p1
MKRKYTFKRRICLVSCFFLCVWLLGPTIFELLRDGVGLLARWAYKQDRYFQEAPIPFKAVPPDISHLPTVPFYMYWGEEFDLIWTHCVEKAIQHAGHDAPRHLVRQLQDHPWRTYEPEEAVLFVIPVAFYDLPSHYFKCGFGKLIQRIAKNVSESKYFIRNDGRDHIIIDNHFHTTGALKYYDIGYVFNRTIRTYYKHLGDRPKDNDVNNIQQCVFAVPMTTSYGPKLFPSSQIEWSKRRFDYFFIGQADKRPAYKPRLRLMEEAKKLAENNDYFPFGTDLSLVAISTSYKGPAQIKWCAGNIPECGDPHVNFLGCRHDQNSALFREFIQKSKFCLTIRGDDYSTKRLYDAFHLGLITVAISDALFSSALPFQCLVPWKDLLYQIPENVFEENPLGVLQNLDSRFGKLGRQWNTSLAMLDKVRFYAKDVLWDLEDSRVATNALVTAARKCLGYRPDWKCPHEDREGWDGIIRGPLNDLEDRH